MQYDQRNQYYLSRGLAVIQNQPRIEWIVVKSCKDTVCQASSGLLIQGTLYHAKLAGTNSLRKFSSTSDRSYMGSVVQRGIYFAKLSETTAFPAPVTPLLQWAAPYLGYYRIETSRRSLNE